MPCIFCLAVFAMLAGAVTTLVLDQMEERLSRVTVGPPERVVDSASVARFDAQVACPPVAGGGQPGRPIAVSVTVYKKYKRVRIQVMTHDLTRAEAEAVEDLVAKALDLDIVDRSDAHDEELVREAFGDDAVEADREAEKTERTDGEKERERAEAQEPPRQR
ncbi:hypothetical protein ACXR2U_05135 [Jatrophihabitans sp. YIM 134969]